MAQSKFSPHLHLHVHTSKSQTFTLSDNFYNLCENIYINELQNSNVKITNNFEYDEDGHYYYYNERINKIILILSMDKQLIGTLSIIHDDNYQHFLIENYGIHSSHHRKGYGSYLLQEAITIITNLFTKHNPNYKECTIIPSVHYKCIITNIPSYNIAKKHHFFILEISYNDYILCLDLSHYLDITLNDQLAHYSNNNFNAQFCTHPYFIFNQQNNNPDDSEDETEYFIQPVIYLRNGMFELYDKKYRLLSHIQNKNGDYLPIKNIKNTQLKITKKSNTDELEYLLIINTALSTKELQFFNPNNIILQEIEKSNSTRVEDCTIPICNKKIVDVHKIYTNTDTTLSSEQQDKIGWRCGEATINGVQFLLSIKPRPIMNRNRINRYSGWGGGFKNI